MENEEILFWSRKGNQSRLNVKTYQLLRNIFNSQTLQIYAVCILAVKGFLSRTHDIYSHNM